MLQTLYCGDAPVFYPLKSILYQYHLFSTVNVQVDTFTPVQHAVIKISCQNKNFSFICPRKDHWKVKAKSNLTDFITDKITDRKLQSSLTNHTNIPGQCCKLLQGHIVRTLFLINIVRQMIVVVNCGKIAWWVQ